ncbi:hypothetical protein F3Y22_tig00110956pilonHSYRG00213 [Hibiscus syriacus]|uniref:BZIP domain-containing protein n=1 Tax=Hibiscus syriacus TaxID=106335 RepID=A0A6A2ZB42_HIBSY|nr:hypothetical protein F3Y22_tig00110956pilonHSYRG00213 [Hibiscus syriacus]
MSSFFSGLGHFLMSDEVTDQNPFPLPAANLILGPSVNIVVGNGVQGSESCEKEQIMEQRRFNRVISNRLSAQRSRMRKLQHIYDMEKQVESLQTQVIVLSAQIQQQKEKQSVDDGKDYIAVEMNELNLQQEDPGHITVAGWEAGGGEPGPIWTGTATD